MIRRPRRFFTGVLAILLGAFASMGEGSAPVRAAEPAPIVDVWSWGWNHSGQLGGVPPNSAVPFPIHAAKAWVAVSAGLEHTLALTENGEVWAWGLNSEGQLGTGSSDPSILPVQVTGLSGITQISAGGFHNLAYGASDQALWAWGSNAGGQLAADASITSSAVPLAIGGLGALRAIAAGSVHSMALTESGVVHAWGSNLRGQLGLGDFVRRDAPVPVPLAGPVSAIAAGALHSLAITASDGQAWSFGWNVFGQIGDGTQGTPEGGVPDPTAVLGVTGVVAVTAGELHSAALTADGHVWSWGYNTEGQAGLGHRTVPNTGVLTPLLLDSIDQVTVLDAGGIHTSALRANGEVWTWGGSQLGACGTNSRADELSPVPVLRISGAVGVSAGGKHTVALAPRRAATRVVTVGGRGGIVDRPDVTVVPGLGDVVALTSGFAHTLVLDPEHRVWSFGDDALGQLGTPGGSHADPQVVPVPLDGAAGIAQVAARAGQSFVLRSDGAVFAWGDNAHGQLGIGTTSNVDTPTRVLLPRVLAIAAGERHGLALDENGEVWAWGANREGALGTVPSLTPRATPARVPALTGITAIAAGGFHSLAVDIVGVVLGWGSGFRAQLGRNGIQDAHFPGAVHLPYDVTAVSAGRFHSLAIRSGGAVWAFGDPTECALGVPPVSRPWEPVPVPGTPAAIVVSAGEHHSALIAEDGAVVTWGNDASAQLGRAGHAFLRCQPAVAEAASGVTAVSGGLLSTVIAIE